MLHAELEKELAHLERVIPHVEAGPFPLGYWHARVHALQPVDSTPASLKRRIERLTRLFSALKALDEAKNADAVRARV